MQDDFAQYVATSQTTWIEPAWKMLLSNKAMLVALWERFAHHPLLLEAHADIKALDGGRWCQKAILGREGQNISYVQGGQHTPLAGSQHDDILAGYGSIYQRWVDLPCFDGYYPVVGSWVVGGRACGMSLREDRFLVTGNDAHFACHVYRQD